MWMMVLEVELLYAGSRLTLIPESLLRLNKEQLLDHCFTCILKSVLALWDLKFRCFPRFHPRKLHGKSFVEDRTATWTSYHSCCKGNRIFCCRDEPIPHRGISCAAGTCSCESSVLCERDCSYGTKVVD